MNKFQKIESSTFVIERQDVDTDQIIPARFLTTTERAGLGAHAFADWRYDDQGRLNESESLNSDAAQAADILVAGNNFGCGSSREHAPWALLDFGFRAILCTEIADIFRSNALKNGLLAVLVDKKLHRYLLDNPGVQTTIDLESCMIAPAGYAATPFEIDRFARHCMLEGIDQLGFILQHESDIARHEQSLT